MITQDGIKSVSSYYLGVAEGILRKNPTGEESELYYKYLNAAKGISDLTPAVIYALVDSGLLNDLITAYAVKGAEMANCVNAADIRSLRYGVRAALDEISAEEMERG